MNTSLIEKLAFSPQLYCCGYLGFTPKFSGIRAICVGPRNKLPLRHHNLNIIDLPCPQMCLVFLSTQL
ncbi:hypothetical protein ACTXT7_004618 [Hymenolepis weldensis]